MVVVVVVVVAVVVGVGVVHVDLTRFWWGIQMMFLLLALLEEE